MTTTSRGIELTKLPYLSKYVSYMYSTTVNALVEEEVVIAKAAYWHKRGTPPEYLARTCSRLLR
jgi:hypothetical protein